MPEQTLTHDKLPRPRGKVIPFPQINNFDSANDYILASYHACVDKIIKSQGAQQRLWESAAQSYIGAYMGIEGLKTMPGGSGLAKAKEQIADANHKADEAAAAGPSA
jgi:hypothetical protein